MNGLEKAIANTHIKESTALQDPDTINFTSVSGQQVDNYNNISASTMMKWCYIQWLKDPLAFSAIEIIIDFVLGDTGIIYTANDKNVQGVLDRFCKINRIRKMCKQRLRDRLINGEICFYANVTKYMGTVKLGWFHPTQISDIKFNRFNIEEPVAIRIGADSEYKEIVRWSDTDEKYVGEVFLYQSNKVGGQSRGLSELFVTRDWFVKHNENLDGIGKYVDGLTRIIWDVTVNGASAEELRAKNAAFQKNPPQKMSWQIHNESEEWKLNTPDVQGADFNEIENIYKGQIAAGMRMPIHFLGRGDDANRATSLSMNSPFYRKIRSDQEDEKEMYTEMGEFVIQKAMEAGVIPEGVDDGFTVSLPEPDKELVYKIADVLSNMSNGLVTLKADDIVSKDAARETAKMLFEQIGIDMSEEDVNNGEEVDEATRAAYDKLRDIVNGE